MVHERLDMGREPSGRFKPNHNESCPYLISHSNWLE